MTQGPRDTIREVDDEATMDDLPYVQAPTYEQAPATIEARPSPFHPLGSLSPTAPGMPSPVTFDPRITEKPSVAIMPPVIVGAPAPSPPEWRVHGAPQYAEQDLAGPTEPDGYPISGSWEGPTDADLGPTPWIDAGPTDVSPAPRKPAPVVPPPGSPTFEISQSLEVEAARAMESAITKPTAAPAPTARPAAQARRRHAPQHGPGPHAPTQVLPALKKKKPREGSDWPLMIGLLALGLVIAGLLGAVAYGVVRSMKTSEPAGESAPAAAPPAR